ncbi:FKBP-type peptidyl-prolyl cis-trans isomerase [Candidatus Pacearchaeota archaeon]|nr:FKBP-type peptidyl-prolyl cis-trans isomerase [Candidatus Pacearchaeota archaeon]
MDLEKTKKNDFIELEFTGKVKDGEVFDTNVPEEAKKIGLEISNSPFVLCLGQEMVIKGLDKELENREIGKEYSVDLLPKDAFQERKSSLIKLIPLNVFTQQKISPRPGMTLALDNMLVKIISVSGGRVLADFNNPLSGKIVKNSFRTRKRIHSYYRNT